MLQHKCDTYHTWFTPPRPEALATPTPIASRCTTRIQRNRRLFTVAPNTFAARRKHKLISPRDKPVPTSPPRCFKQSCCYPILVYLAGWGRPERHTPRNSMCSKKWASPGSPGGSDAAPTSTDIAAAALVALGSLITITLVSTNAGAKARQRRQGRQRCSKSAT